MKNKYILDKVHELPTLPTIVYELHQLINDPMSSVSEVEAVVTNDQAISSKLLKLSNSAFYSVSGGVGSLKRAISILGFNTVNEVVLSMNVIKMFKAENSQFSIPQFWKHSLGVANCAMSIEEYLNKGASGNDLFSCGLLHDLGKIAFYSVDSKNFIDVYSKAEKNKTSLLIEEQLAEYNSALIGSELIKRWKLPLLLQKTTYYSGNSFSRTKTDYMLTEDILQAIDIVKLADILINRMCFGHDGTFHQVEIDPQIITRLRLKDQDLVKINALVLESLQKTEKFLSIIENN